MDCEPDDAGGGDDLGNHVAELDLTMGSHFIDFASQSGLRASGGAELKTGVNGGTFQLFAGGSSADIARFWASSTPGPTLMLSIARGGVHFNGGQKVCSCYGGNGRSTVLVSAGWTAVTCSAYRNAVCPDGDYQLFCLFDDGFTFGTANGGIPSPENCGW